MRTSTVLAVASASRNQGLDEAAAYLEKTAADFEEMATRVDVGLLTRRVYGEKAALLRGQAKHIRELKRAGV